MCSRRGGLLWFVPRQQLSLGTPAADYATYTFNNHRIKHHFCPTCGIAPFSEASDKSGNPMAAVNARCLEGVEISALKVMPFDGRSL
jgi:hypothetical protein